MEGVNDASNGQSMCPQPRLGTAADAATTASAAAFIEATAAPAASHARGKSARLRSCRSPGSERAATGRRSPVRGARRSVPGQGRTGRAARATPAGRRPRHAAAPRRSRHSQPQPGAASGHMRRRTERRRQPGSHRRFVPLLVGKTSAGGCRAAASDDVEKADGMPGGPARTASSASRPRPAVRPVSFETGSPAS